MEKLNSQLKYGQPMKQTRGLYCTCDSGVASWQSQHRYHFWRISSMFETYCTGKLAWQLSNKCCVNYEAINGCKNVKIH